MKTSYYILSGVEHSQRNHPDWRFYRDCAACNYPLEEPGQRSTHARRELSSNRNRNGAGGWLDCQWCMW